jgi:hypothetical protein
LFGQTRPSPPVSKDLEGFTKSLDRLETEMSRVLFCKSTVENLSGLGIATDFQTVFME